MITRARPGCPRIVQTGPNRYAPCVPKAWWIAVLRLSGLLLAVGMAASRLGLILHELGGHGGFAIALGGEVTGLKLFWFGGGWITYSVDQPTVLGAISTALGGIIIEAVLGAALMIGLHRADARATAAGHTRIGIRILRGIGAAFLGHACWYFATGTWHGYGDGLPTYRAFGDGRYPIGIVVGLGACGAAFLGARWSLGAFAALLPGARRARGVGVAIAMTVAATLLVVPAVIEFQLRGDTRYGAIMKREGDRLAERELARWLREQAKRGEVIDDHARQLATQRIASRHREPPFLPVLGALVAVAVALGAWRSRAAPGVTVTPRLLAIAAVIGAGSLAAVIALDFAFH
jgi:hypothetical protein